MPSDYANDLMARVGLDTTEWKKGITDLNSGIKHIETGFQATAALMDDWGSSSEGLKKRVESLNDKLALQKQKLEVLKKAYEEEVEKSGASSRASQNLAKQMYAAANEINRTKASVEKYTDKLENMGLTAEKVSDKLDTYASKTRTLSTVAAAGLTAISAGLVKAGQNADELNTLAKQTGLTVEEIQKIQYASDLMDVELTDITGSLRKMTKNMVSTSSEVKAAWDTLGVATTDYKGEARSVTDVFYDLLDALSKVSNETERDQLAMQIFGKSANDLAGIVDDGGAALRQLGEEAEAAGLIMSQDAVDGANEFNDVIDTMKAKLTASLGKAFSENAFELTDSMESLADTIVSIVNAIADLPPWTTKAAIGVLAVGSAISPLLTVGSKAVKVFSSIQKVIKAKTAATTAATVAETAHAGAMTTTGTAATGAAGKVKAFGTALKTSIPTIGAVVLALGALKEASDFFEEKKVEEAEQSYEDEMQRIEELHGKKIENMSEELTAYETAAEEEIAAAEKSYDEQIDMLDDNLKAKKKAIEDEKKAYEKAHKQRLKQLEEERDAQLELIDISTSKATSVLQEQIDSIDGLTAAEDKAEKERENAAKLAELQQNILNARSLTEREEAQKEYSEFVAELEREKTLNAREEQKQRLQDEIDRINAEADEQREAVNAEYEQAKELEEQKNEIAQEGFEARLESLDTYIESETERLNALKEANVSRLRSETSEYIEQLQARIDKETELKEAAEKRAETMKELETSDAEDNSLMKSAISGFFGIMTPKVSKASLFEGIGANASGTDNWRGGLTRINELGGEIVNLPRGTQIIPHDVSMEMARSYGRQAAITNSTTNNYSTTETTNNNYASQQRVTNFNIAGHRVGTIIEPEVSEIAAMRAKQRRRAGRAY